MNWRYPEGGRFPLCIRDPLFQVLCNSEYYVYCLYLGMTSVCGDISVRDVSHLLREIMGAVTAAPETGTLSSRDGQQAPCDVQISFKPWLHKSDCEIPERTLFFIVFSIVIIYIYGGQNVIKHWINLFTAPLRAERNKTKLLSLKFEVDDISNNTMIIIVKCWLGIEGAVKNTIMGREMSIKEKGDIFVSPRYMPSCWVADKTQFENSTRERKRRWRFKGLVKYQVKDYFQFFWAKFLLFGWRINLNIRKWPFLWDRNDIILNIKHDNFEPKSSWLYRGAVREGTYDQL